MDDNEIQVMGETLGKLAAATARVIGDLAFALGQQPGVDGAKLIHDFLEALPNDPEALGAGHSIVDGVRAYLDPAKHNPAA